MSMWVQIAIACPMIFLASFIDAIAGGGGLISLPTFLMLGLPSHMAIGTNKFSACCGIIFSTREFVSKGHINRSIVPATIAGALVGSFAGSRLAVFLDEQVLRWVMIVLIPIVAVVTLLKKDFFEPSDLQLPVRKMQILTLILSLVIGAYDGFFGPGTGTFALLALMGIVRLDAVTACGNTKIMNLASNLTAMAMFVYFGKVVFYLAVPCAVFAIAGSHLGARVAIKKGVKIIKPIMGLVVALLMVKLVMDVLSTISAAH